MSEQADKRTATQKIEDLEKVVTMLFQNVAILKNATDSLMRSQGDMGLVKDALKLLNKKTEATILAAKPETGISIASVSALVVQMNVDELKAQVESYLKGGHLTLAEEVASDSYIVCEEYNRDGSLASPRTQFRVDSQDEATGAVLKGKKAGDMVDFGETKFPAKILEIYSIVEPKPTEEQSALNTSAAPAPEVTPAASDSSDVSATEATAPATEAAPTAQDTPLGSAASPGQPLSALPAESPVGFALEIHGQAEAAAPAVASSS